MDRAFSKLNAHASLDRHFDESTTKNGSLKNRGSAQSNNQST